ncbi:MAG: CoA-binding protein [Methanobacteriota archaeon]|nr:MAG: CoA-binding protein [Euryarchaeota archaeon]
MQILQNFFTPKSVAIVGASNNPTKVGYSLLHNLRLSGYEGKIYPVNLREKEVQGLKAYKSLKEIPEEIDLLVVSIPAQYVLDLLDEAHELQIKSVLIISAGFKETGAKGAELEQKLLKKIREYGMRVIGPNCLGLIDNFTPLNITFTKSSSKKGDLGFISQSGAMITGILDWSTREDIGFSKFISVGNKLDIDEVELIELMGNDPNTKAILLYLEAINKGREFIEVCRRVVRKKPIIAIKSGTSKAGARAASSHTGAMAGANTAYDTAFEKSGVIRVERTEDLFTIATTFSWQPLPRSNQICIITNAGGPGIIATDHAEFNGLNLATLSSTTINTLKENLHPAAATHNPIDVLGTGGEKEYRLSMELAMKDPNVGMILVILAPQEMTKPMDIAKVITEIKETYPDKPIAASFFGGEAMEEALEFLKKNRVPAFAFPEKGILALAGLWKYQKILAKPEFYELPREFPDVQKETVQEILDSVVEKRRVTLLGSEAIAIANAYGIRAPKTETAFTKKEAIEIAERIGYPLVMKITSPQIMHKTDIKGVRIGIRNEDELVEAFEEMMRSARRHFPHARVIGVDIQQLAQPSTELIIGVSKDPQFGHLAIIGTGGIYTNIYEDVSFGLVPVTHTEATHMIERTKVYSILQGARGGKKADIASVIETLERVSRLIQDFPQITDLDINPLFADETGVMAVDVKITISRDEHKRLKKLKEEEQ